MRNLKLTAAMPAIALGLAFTLPVSAQTSGTATTPASRTGDDDRSDTVTPSRSHDATSMRASMKMPKKSGDIIGKAVKADDGNDLGSISDLAIDSSSGKITHAIIRSGGVLGVGADHKAVNFDSLELAGEDGFTLAASGWSEAKTFREDQLTSLQDDTMSGANPSQVLLVSKLDDVDLHNLDGTEIGEVEDVIIEADEHKASLLVEVEDEIAGDDRLFVIGFDRVTVGGTDDERMLNTELQDSDFRTAAANEQNTEQPYIWLEDADRAVAE